MDTDFEVLSGDAIEDEYQTPACDFDESAHCNNVGGRCWFMATMTVIERLRSFIIRETELIDVALAFAAEMTACTDDQTQLNTCARLPKLLAMAYKQRVQNVSYNWPYSNLLYSNNVNLLAFWSGLFRTCDQMAKTGSKTSCILRITFKDGKVMTLRNVYARPLTKATVQVKLKSWEQYVKYAYPKDSTFYDPYYLPLDTTKQDRRSTARGFTSGISFTQVANSNDSHVIDYRVAVKSNCHVVEGGNSEQLFAAIFGIRLFTDKWIYPLAISNNIDAFADRINELKRYSDENTSNKFIILPFSATTSDADTSTVMFSPDETLSHTLKRIMRHPLFADYQLLGGFALQSDHVVSFVICDKECRIVMCDPNDPVCTTDPTQLPEGTVKVKLIMQKTVGWRPRWCVSDGVGFQDKASVPPPPKTMPDDDPNQSFEWHRSNSPEYGRAVDDDLMDTISSRFVDLCYGCLQPE